MKIIMVFTTFLVCSLKGECAPELTYENWIKTSFSKYEYDENRVSNYLKLFTSENSDVLKVNNAWTLLDAWISGMDDRILLYYWFESNDPCVRKLILSLYICGNHSPNIDLSIAPKPWNNFSKFNGKEKATRAKEFNEVIKSRRSTAKLLYPIVTKALGEKHNLSKRVKYVIENKNKIEFENTLPDKN